MSGLLRAVRPRPRPVLGEDVFRLDNVSVGFRRNAIEERSLKHALAALVTDRRQPPHQALDDVTLHIRRGEHVGVIGRNGAGKSTLLRVLARVITPQSGRVFVDRGVHVVPLLELGIGFQADLSGIENVHLAGALMGYSYAEIASKMADIVEFAELQGFIHEPVKNYSSGMYVRLGFAVAINTDPDVLLVDEVLAVGDEAFAHRCLRRIEEFLAAGKTLLLVSHSLDLVGGVCDRVLWLDNGRQRLVGEPRRVIDAYRQEVAEREGEEHREAKKQRERAGEEVSEELRWGSRDAEIVSLRLIAGGEEKYHLTTGEDVTLEIRARAARPLDDFVFGVAISTPRDHEVWGTNTDIEGYAAGLFEGEAVVRLTCPGFRLAPGEYLVDVAIHSKEGVAYDYQRRALTFTVTAPAGGVGVYFPEHRWEFSGGLEWKELDSKG